MTKTYHISKCCKGDAEYIFDDKNDGYLCLKCGKMCEVECEYCGGTGEVSTDETDESGNVMRGVGTRKCECRLNDQEDEI